MPEPIANLPSVEELARFLSDDLQDDDLGLWEVVWRLNTLAPAAPLEAKISLARQAVAGLLDSHDLWRGEWPSGPIALLSDEEMQTLARDDVPWHDPEHATLLVWMREKQRDPATRTK